MLFFKSHPVPALGALAACLLLSVSAVHAADESPQSRYQRHMADCSATQSADDRRTCQREVHSARAEARRGQLSNPGADYAANAMRRCSVFEASARADCEARMGANARMDGSVQGGGMLREATTPALPSRAQ